MNKPLIFFILAGLTGLPAGLLAQETVRNYGFEYLDAFNRLVSWAPQNPDNKFVVQLSFSEVKEGKCSVVIGLDPAKKADFGEKPGAGLVNTGLGKRDFEGHKTITVSGYIKTKELQDGIASFWMELKGSGRIIQGINSDAESPSGDSEWKKYTITLPIDPETLYIGFGCKMTGYGLAFFDGVEVLLDGEPVGGTSTL